MAKKTGAFKPVKIKQFKDMNMWAAPIGTVQTPAPVSKRPGMDPHDMNAEGTTGDSARGSASIGDKGTQRY